MLRGNLAGTVLVTSVPTQNSFGGKSWSSLASQADCSGKCCAACHMMLVGEGGYRVGNANHVQVALKRGKQSGWSQLVMPTFACLLRGSRADRPRSGLRGHGASSASRCGTPDACLTLLLGFRSFAEPVQHCIEAQKRLARCSVRCQVSRCLTIEGPSCDRSVRGLPPTLRRYMRAYRCHARWPSVTQTNIPFPVCLSKQNPT